MKAKDDSGSIEIPGKIFYGQPTIGSAIAFDPVDPSLRQRIQINIQTVGLHAPTPSYEALSADLHPEGRPAVGQDHRSRIALRQVGPCVCLWSENRCAEISP